MANLKIHIDTEYGFVEAESSKSCKESYIDILDYLACIDEPEVQKWAGQQMEIPGVTERLTKARQTQWIL